MKQRFFANEGDLNAVNQKKLDCEGCQYKTSMVGICAQYPDVKPKSVLMGEKCPKRKPKDER